MMPCPTGRAVRSDEGREEIRGGQAPHSPFDEVARAFEDDLIGKGDAEAVAKVQEPGIDGGFARPCGSGILTYRRSFT